MPLTAPRFAAASCAETGATNNSVAITKKIAALRAVFRFVPFASITKMGATHVQRDLASREPPAPVYHSSGLSRHRL